MTNINQLTQVLLHEYGPLMGGNDLRRALGFQSAAAFQRAVRDKTVNIRVFSVPSRRGKFALTADVATWLAEISNSGQYLTGDSTSDHVAEAGSRELANASEEVKM